MTSEKKRVVAIIPARGGSKGLPGKNIKMLAGKPLIYYSIEAARQCELIHRVIVSTEDKEIAKIARKYGAEVPFMRPLELADDDTPAKDVVRHVVFWLEEEDNYPVDIVVSLQPTDIFRRKYMVDAVIRELLEKTDVDCAFIAYRDHKNYWKKENDKFVPLSWRGYVSRQKKEHIYREDTGLAYARRAWVVKQDVPLRDCRVSIIPNNDTQSFVDIHDDFDLWLADKIITGWGYPINK